MSTPNTSLATNPLAGYQTFSSATPAKKQLDMAAFLHILTVQMVNQNPLEPMKDSDYFAQIAQMGTVQGIDAIKTSQQNVQATTLIGKTVDANREPNSTDSSTAPVHGVVQYVTSKAGTPYIGVKEANGGIAEVQLGAIQKITA